MAKSTSSQVKDFVYGKDSAQVRMKKNGTFFLNDQYLGQWRLFEDRVQLLGKHYSEYRDISAIDDKSYQALNTAYIRWSHGALHELLNMIITK